MIPVLFALLVGFYGGMKVKEKLYQFKIAHDANFARAMIEKVFSE